MEGIQCDVEGIQCDVGGMKCDVEGIQHVTWKEYSVGGIKEARGLTLSCTVLYVSCYYWLRSALDGRCSLSGSSS